MIDKKKLDTAILYLQRIADGKNPVNNMPAEDDMILNNPNVIRCMFFVKEVLEEVRRNGGSVGRRLTKAEKSDFTLESLKNFEYREDKPITRLVKQMNEAVDSTVCRKLSYKPILQWLKLNEFLMEEYSQEYNKIVTLPTEKGAQIGIRAEKRISSQGNKYIWPVYGKKAQEYIVKNIEAILNGEVAGKRTD